MKSTKRRSLPTRRPSWTHHAHVGGQSVFFSIGEHLDGTPAEIFIDVAKAGSAMRAVLHVCAIFASLALRYGCPLRKIISAIKGLDFEPSGTVTGSANVKEAESILDYIAQELAATYPHLAGIDTRKWRE